MGNNKKKKGKTLKKVLRIARGIISASSSSSDDNITTSEESDLEQKEVSRPRIKRKAKTECETKLATKKRKIMSVMKV